jgi:hypothetical protein
MKDINVNNVPINIVSKKRICQSKGQGSKIILKTNCVTRSFRKKIDNEVMQGAVTKKNSSNDDNSLKGFKMNYKTRTTLAAIEKCKRIREERKIKVCKNKCNNDNKEVKSNFRIRSLKAKVLIYLQNSE